MRNCAPSLSRLGMCLGMPERTVGSIPFMSDERLLRGDLH